MVPLSPRCPRVTQVDDPRVWWLFRLSRIPHTSLSRIPVVRARNSVSYDSAPGADFYMDDVEKMAREFFGTVGGVHLIGSSASNREAAIMMGARGHLRNFNPTAFVIAKTFISGSVNPVGTEKTPKFRRHGDA